LIRVYLKICWKDALVGNVFVCFYNSWAGAWRLFLCLRFCFGLDALLYMSWILYSTGDGSTHCLWLYPVFKNPAQSPSHEFWPGQLYFFYKSKRHYFDKKIKKLVNGLQLSFWPSLAGQPTSRVGRVFNYPYFFINLAQFQSRVDPPSQARF
jgi:hypothetical protein